MEITVKQGGDGDIRYQVSRNGTVTMKDQDFNDLCRDLTGSTLSHVRFQLPPSSQGTLYHRYGTSESTRVSAGRNYYRSSAPRLDQVTFEAASGSGGTVEIAFTGWSVSDESFTGTILIDLDRSGASADVVRYTVRQNRSVDFEDVSFNALCRDLTGESLSWTILIDLDRSGASADVVRYTVRQNRSVDFEDVSFNALCRDLTGESLSWVRFEETPSSAEGTLCYQYREDSGRYDKLVTTGKSYYRSSAPRIDRISFVANGSRTGVVELAFTGCSSGSEQFRGVVEITVESSDTAISYSSSGGFVANGSRTGVVELAFTGCSSGSEQFRGVVEITVESSDTAISYSSSGGTVLLRTQDFLDLCREEGLKKAETVQFTPPAASAGHLYYRYTAPLKYGAEVRSGTSYRLDSGSPSVSDLTFVPKAEYRGSAGHLYYRYTAPLKYGAEVRSGTSYRLDSGSPSVSDLTFVPKAEYRGTVTIPFTAYDAKGKTCGGTVRISVQPAAYSSYFSDMGSHSWAAAAVNYLYENGVVKGAKGKTCGGTVRISVQPAAYSSYFSDMGSHSWAAAAVNYLYENGVVKGGGNGLYHPGSKITRGQFMIMLSRAFQFSSASTPGFSDVPANSYYAEASGNGLYHPGSKITRGQFMIMLSRAFQFSSASTPGFSDVPANSYYAEAIAAAKERGIASGYANGAFRPDAPISRQDATVFLQRALRSAGWSISGSESTLSAYPDGAQVGSHARGAMAAISRQDATVFLQRALRSAGWSISGSESTLSAYPDGAQVGSHARGAMAAMVERGILRGNAAGRLNPYGSLTRAEMAVILYRALTM